MQAQFVERRMHQEFQELRDFLDEAERTALQSLKQEEEDDEDLQILGCPSREVMGGEGDLSWFRFNRVPPPFIPFSRFLALSP